MMCSRGDKDSWDCRHDWTSAAEKSLERALLRIEIYGAGCRTGRLGTLLPGPKSATEASPLMMEGAEHAETAS